MDPTYNLVDEPFVPCLMQDGTLTELGLLPTLTRAHEVREIVHSSPLVTCALYRLLLAVLQRVHCPGSLDEWEALWSVGHWESQPLQTYFNTWRERFDLFDEEHPFYQVSDYDPEDVKGINKLAHELASGNNATLFEHSSTDDFAPVGPAEAGRLLVTRHAFDTSGLGGGTIITQSGASKRVNFSDTPCARKAVVLLSGSNLFETLALNLLVCRDSEPMPQTGEDLPAWERDSEPGLAEKRIPDGYVDYLTWQSRRIRLVPASTTNGPEVRMCHLRQGELIPVDIQDPMVPYSKGKGGWDGLRLREDRALWRDSTALLRLAEPEQKVPAAVDQTARLIKKGTLSRDRLYRTSVLGFSGLRAKILFWRHEHLPIPGSYLTDQTLVASLHNGLQMAERASTALYAACSEFAEEALHPGPEGSASPADKEQLRAAVDPRQHYWTRLHERFHRFLVELPGDEEHQQDRLAAWAEEVTQKAGDAFESALRSRESSARTARAGVLARRQLYGRLKQPTPA